LVHGRRPDAPGGLIADLLQRGANAVTYFAADLADLDKVGLLADQVRAAAPKVDVLVNNAGVFDPPERVSPQGLDTTWAVNVAAPYALTHGLLPCLANGDGGGRVVTTSSISQSSRLPDDFARTLGKPPAASSYSAHRAYSESKWGDRLFAQGLAAHSSAHCSALRSVTMDPGTVNTKMLLAGWGACGISVAAADQTYLLAATAKALEGPNGGYFFGGSGSADARDESKVAALWALLEAQTGRTYPPR